MCDINLGKMSSLVIHVDHTQGIDKRRVERACKHGVMQSVDLMAKTGTVRMMLINIILAGAVAAAVAFLL